MQIFQVSIRSTALPLLSAGFLPFVSCTGTSSNLSALSRQNMQAVAKIATEEPTATESAEAPALASTESSPATDAPTASPATPTNLSLSAPPSASPLPPLTPIPAERIAGLPETPAQLAPNDPVALPKPEPTQPPVTLASVPRTPVSNRPTNQIMMVRTTAYTHTESDHLKYGRKSAAGTTLQYGSRVRSAAADWSKYPLGTRFVIEGMPYEYVVDDYGSALVGTETIDIYKPEKGTMNHWGVRNVPIRVLEWGSFEESRRILESRKHVRDADHVRKMLNDIEKQARSGNLSTGIGRKA